MIHKDLGEVKISKDVITKIVKLTLGEVESVSNFSNDALKKIYTKGPKVELVDNKVKVNAYITLYYGSDVRKEVENLQAKVKESIEEMIGLEVLRVNVYVYDITPKEEY